MSEQPHYRSLEASEMFCQRCRQARPVRQHLLLVLPTGNQVRLPLCGLRDLGGLENGLDASDFSTLLSGRK